jgi:cell division protein FtsB
MNNLSVRERAMIFAVLLLLIGGLVFVFGIRPLSSKYDDLVAQKEAKEAEKRQLDALKQSNNETKKQIESLQEKCKSIESSFIAEVRTENIIDYVQSELQAAGVPFLVEINTESVATEEIKLPDGTVSNDSLLCTRLTAKYSTTDGRTVEAAGVLQDDGTVLGHIQDPATGQIIDSKKKEVKDNTNKPNPENPNGYGYDQIIAAVKKIAEVNKQCVKISNVVDTAKIGFHEITVSVDFYGAILNERLSDATDNSPYAVWKGNNNPNFEGGILGNPYHVENELSMWNGYFLSDKEVTNFGYRPFANYLSDAIITKMLKDGNGTRALYSDNANKPGDIDTSETTPAA